MLFLVSLLRPHSMAGVQSPPLEAVVLLVSRELRSHLRESRSQALAKVRKSSLVLHSNTPEHLGPILSVKPLELNLPVDSSQI